MAVMVPWILFYRLFFILIIVILIVVIPVWISLIDFPALCGFHSFIIRVCKEGGVMLTMITGGGTGDIRCTVRICSDHCGTLYQGCIFYERYGCGAIFSERTVRSGREVIISVYNLQSGCCSLQAGRCRRQTFLSLWCRFPEWVTDRRRCIHRPARFPGEPQTVRLAGSHELAS